MIKEEMSKNTIRKKKKKNQIKGMTMTEKETEVDLEIDIIEEETTRETISMTEIEEAMKEEIILDTIEKEIMTRKREKDHLLLNRRSRSLHHPLFFLIDLIKLTIINSQNYINILINVIGVIAVID